jgi:hypothetical protein
LTDTSLVGKTTGVACSGGQLTITGGSVTATAGDAFTIESGPGAGGRVTGSVFDGGAPGGGPSEAGARGGGPGGGPPGAGDPGGGGAPGDVAFRPVSTEIIVKGGVKIKSETGILIKVTKSSKATFTAEDQELTGDIVVDETGAIDIILRNSTLTGKIDGAAMILNPGSSWDVTGDSTLTSLSNRGGVSGSAVSNIIGNGHTVYYDPDLSANTWLKGMTYSLSKRGKLVPKK